mgnify:CR=1 FL=1
MTIKETEQELLDKYVCKVPFRHIEIFEGRTHLCCASWLDTPIKHKFDKDGNEDIDVWNAELTKDIRRSVLNGSYKYCNKKLCPHLSTLINTGKPTGWLVEKDRLPYKDWDGFIIPNSDTMDSTPASINFTFDRSCNLKCPSCRVELIMAKPGKVDKINTTLDFINNNYAENVRKIFITGSGDPFASKSFRKFLQEFDYKKYPNLQDLSLSTNGILFNKKQWDLIKNAHPYIKTVEISIDAATKNTYENVTRLGGNWEILMDNLEFVNSIESIENLRLSFVVQQSNYKEMYDFTNLIIDKFKSRLETQRTKQNTIVYFGQIAPWEALTAESYKKQAVAEPTHPEHNELIKEVGKVFTLSNQIKIESNLTNLL